MTAFAFSSLGLILLFLRLNEAVGENGNRMIKEESASLHAIHEFNGGPTQGSKSLLHFVREVEGDDALSAANRSAGHFRKRETAYTSAPAARLPLPSCFFDEKGYICCNRDLRTFLQYTFEEYYRLNSVNPCTVQSAINHIHSESEKRYNVSMEAVLGYEDYAQMVRFRGDLVCKFEIGGRFLMAYASPRSEYRLRRSVDEQSNLDNEHQALV